MLKRVLLHGPLASYLSAKMQFIFIPVLYHSHYRMAWDEPPNYETMAHPRARIEFVEHAQIINDRALQDGNSDEDEGEDNDDDA